MWPKATRSLVNLITLLEKLPAFLKHLERPQTPIRNKRFFQTKAGDLKEVWRHAGSDCELSIGVSDAVTIPEVRTPSFMLAKQAQMI